MAKEFLGKRLVTADEARATFAAAWSPRYEPETVPTADALGRVLAERVVSPEDLPPFRRSLMDGFACRATDISVVPVTLRVVADVPMGEVTDAVLGPGEAARVPTGGMLPENADVVVPVEQTRSVEITGAEGVEIHTALTAGRHLIERGEDVTVGEEVLPARHRLRPADVGALMGLGLVQVSVFRLPVVGILSTGDEVVPSEETPPLGKVRDLNSYSLAAYVQSLGGVASRFGIVKDDPELLHAAAAAALAECDVLILNAGTSVGPKDVVAGVIQRLGAPGVLVHGVDIRPGKPTIFAVCGGKPVFGLPGQPVSVLNTFDQFVAPVLRQMLLIADEPRTLTARLTEDLRSADGREDHVRVRLQQRDDGWWATPVFGVSAMISTMVLADGITIVPSDSPGFNAGDAVEVRPLG